ncbi:SDR family NAD(P)-dependent oxidoreductase [Streptomyces sp. NPDC001262]|uniref:SDR family NAD(P)-dependent oxidoreductase n=1 Tax=Streptomyces sp. NPDC001262 TaxID=3364552 RepID=UPI003682B5DD
MERIDRAVAVVGVGCRLPGGITDLDGLWTALREGRELVGEIPADRFDKNRFVDPGAVRPGRSRTAAGGFLDDVAGFDAAYFGIAPDEAAHMDPQQRLLLEMAVEALDDSGIPAESLAGSDTCVFVGISEAHYGTFQTALGNHASPYAVTGARPSIAANRLSYCFDLHGPSMAVDTACSSALVALDRACRTLLDGTSRTALVGGVNVLLNPFSFTGLSHAGMLSPSGRCAAFSAEADGFVRAEGGGVLVLKRLADALADGDRIHAVIAGTGTNCGGRTGGLTLPGTESQEALLRSVHRQAGVAPDDLVYVEAHGIGTAAGDLAEAGAIGRALGQRRTTGPLPIGSVKSNLGHLEPASGMAGLLKALLVLRYGLAPATLHARPLNPDIDFAGLGLAPTVAPVGLPRRARAAVGVNSFGFGGANAHAVLTAPPRLPVQQEHGAGPVPVVVSARSPEALQELAARVAARLRRATDAEFYDLAHTTTLRRSAHPYRAAVLAGGPQQAADRLDRIFADAPSAAAEVRKAERDTVAYVFSGDGSQWPGMAAELMHADPVFVSAVEEADAALAPHLGWSVAKELTHPVAARWQRTEVAQPLLFAVQMGMVAVLAANGLRPAAVVGHGAGEAAAALVSGALTLDQAARVIAERSRAQGATVGTGRMAAVGLSGPEARQLLAPYGTALELAGIHSDRDVTVTGDPDALAALGARLKTRGVFFRDLGLDYAFHSRAMDPIAVRLCTALTGLAPAAVRIPMVSTVTGAPLSGEELTARYWWHNVREPVRFADAVAHVLADAADIVLEIGPHPVLRPYLRRTRAVCIPTLHRDGDGSRDTAAAVAGLVAAGAAVDWRPHFPRPGRVADLPGYPWQRERHWHGTPQDFVLRTGGTGLLDHPLLGERLPAPHPLWEGAVEPQLVPWLGDHRVAGTVLMPAAAYVETVLSAGRRALERPVELRHLEITGPLPLDWPDPAGITLHTALTPEDGTLAIGSSQGRGTACRPVARARVRTLPGTAPAPLDPDAIRARCPRTVDGPDHYRACRRAGLDIGPAFQVLRELHVGTDELLASYEHEAPGDPYTVHPAVLDGPLQAAVALVGQQAGDGQFCLPSAFGSVRVWRTPSPAGIVHLRQRSRTGSEFGWDITYADADGTVTAEIEGCRVRIAHHPDHAPLTVRHTVLRAAPLPASPAASSPLPPPPDLMAAVADRTAALRTALNDTGYDRFTAAVEETGAHCWRAALDGLLADAGPGAPFRVSGLVAHGLRPHHRRLARLMLPLVARHGLAEPARDGYWRLTGTAPRHTALLRSLVEDHPAFHPETALLNRQLRRLPEVLRSTVEPLDDTAYEHLCATAPAHRFTQDVARAALGETLRHWPEDRPLRILELGAGTHALTAALLPLLPADRTRYTCTTSGSVRAEHRFAAYDFVDHRTLDLDTDPVAQGFRPGEFDLVVADDTLHTAAVLTAALRRLRILLAPGGLLLATEQHHAQRLGLLEGSTEAFWQRADRAMRPQHRLLPWDRWVRLLGECGFTDTARTGIEERSVLLATADRPPVREPALPEPTPGAPWVVAVENPAEVPTGQALCDLLGDTGTVVATDDVAAWSAQLPHGAKEPGVALLLAEAEPGGTASRTAARAAVLRALAAACAGLPDAVRPQVWLITRPSGLFPAPERPDHPADAAVWGVARTQADAHPGLQLRRISLDRSGDPAADALRLARELLAPGDEDEIVLTRRGRFVPRETERTGGEPAPVRAGAPFVLDVRTPEPSRRPVWREAGPLAPGPDEILVEMRAVALGHGDPLDTELHTEGAGIVRAVGPGVSSPEVGDEVCGIMPAALASHAVTRTDTVIRIPEGLSHAEAATLPAAFTTAHVTLVHRARPEPGETVLVHEGAGSVGLAALQCARTLGAHVIATAGNEIARDLLRTLGVEHVLDSGSLDFVPRVRELTGGRGVDVVVNTLSGEAAARSLDLLRPDGRFIELGTQPMPLRPFRRSLTVIGFDLDSVRGRQSAHGLAECIASGAYRPLPHSVRPAARVEEAFRQLRNPRHTGKVVVSFDPLDEPVPVEPGPTAPTLDPEGTYLVTGGLGGLGAATAAWLADRGARHLALIDGRGAGGPDAAAVLQRLAGRGAAATAYAADVTDEAAVRRVIAAVDATGHPLRGIAHCAAHEDEDPSAGFAAAFAVRAAGADVLHRLTADREPDVFLLHSSVSAHAGTPAHAPDAAASAYLDALTRARRRDGRCGAAVSWGPMADAGTGSGEAFGVAGRALDTGADVFGVGRHRWARTDSLLAAAGTAEPDDDRAELLRSVAAMPPEDAVRTVTGILARLLGAVLRTDPAVLDADRGLQEFGLDSLMSAEFLLRAREYFAVRLLPAELMGSGRTLAHVARLVHRHLAQAPAGMPPGR